MSEFEHGEIIVVGLVCPVSNDASWIPSLVGSPSGLGWMVLAKTVDDHLDTRRICERVTFEHYNKELVDAGTIVAKCANDFYIVLSRHVGKEISKLSSCCTMAEGFTSCTREN